MNSQSSGYLLQGFFFQEREYLGIAMMPIEGALAVIRQGVTRSMFAGLVWQDDWIGELMGEMDDQFGQSHLTDVTLSDSEFSFIKCYERRNDNIVYTFQRSDDVWVGTYAGERVGEGSAYCILTPIPGHMFQAMQG